MELEHLLGIGIAFVVSILLIWVVWSYFCNDGKNSSQEDSNGEESDNFSSTHVITSAPIKKKRRRRSRQRSQLATDSSNDCCETTTDEEGEKTQNEKRRPRRKSRRMSSGGHQDRKDSAYSYQQNGYGLHDPFGEWAPKAQPNKDFVAPVQIDYPKSPGLKRANNTAIQHV